jgi:hypothetical protein
MPRHPIETLIAQFFPLHFGCAYLESRCASPDAIAEETWGMLRLLEGANKEEHVFQCLLDVIDGNLRPMLG